MIRGAAASAAGGGQQPIRAEQAAEGAAGHSDSTPPAGGDKPSTDGSDRDTATHTHIDGAGATHQESAGRTHTHRLFDLWPLKSSCLLLLLCRFLLFSSPSLISSLLKVESLWTLTSQGGAAQSINQSLIFIMTTFNLPTE